MVVAITCRSHILVSIIIMAVEVGIIIRNAVGAAIDLTRVVQEAMSDRGSITTTTSTAITSITNNNQDGSTK